MKPFHILATSDVHGSIYAHQYHNHQTLPSGLSRLSTALKQFQDEEVILIDNGDVLQGTPLTTYNNKFETQSIMAEAFNALGYDYFNLGNHDFNYGPTILKRYLQTQQATSLCSNILIDGQPIGHSQIHITQENLKLGLIGVVTDYLPNWEKPENLENITILDVVETVKLEVEELRTLVDHIIVIYHGGFERDLITNEPTEPLTGENVGSLLTTIPGIDVLITGHQHRSIVQTINHVLCLQCNMNASEVMKITYDGSFHGELLNLSQFEIDHEFENLFITSEQKTQTWLDTQIGIGPEMAIHNVFEAQLNKSLYTTFINHFLIQHYGVDLAFSSLFNQSPGLKPTITMRDLVASYPYPNTITIVQMDKTTLIAYLEQIATYFTLVDEEIRINPKFIIPKLSMYDYDMGDGLSYTIDVSEPEGQRIKNLVLPEKDLFTVAVNNYRASGGGNYLMVKQAPKIKEDTTEVIDLLYEYIQTQSPLNVEDNQNINIVKDYK